MALRKFLWLDAANEGSSVEENPLTDSAQIGQLITGGLNGVGINASGTRIASVATPSQPTDAANKAYVDAAALHTTIAEINVGPVGVNEYIGLWGDTSITPASKILCTLCGQAPSGKDADELTMDALHFVATPLNNQIQFFIKGLEGQIHGAFRFAYSVGV